MFKHGNANPLNVFGLRRLQYCPNYFEIIVFTLYTNDKVITDWIYENLTGRFYFGDKVVLNADNKTTIEKVAGFEKPDEASFFGLLLPNINVSRF
jgi:hypothetical protein